MTYKNLQAAAAACSSENCPTTEDCAASNNARVCVQTSNPIIAEQLMETQASGGTSDVPQRRKLNLKPRDESAVSKAETEKKSSRSVRPNKAALMRCVTNTPNLHLMSLGRHVAATITARIDIA